MSNTPPTNPDDVVGIQVEALDVATVVRGLTAQQVSLERSIKDDTKVRDEADARIKATRKTLGGVKRMLAAAKPRARKPAE